VPGSLLFHGFGWLGRRGVSLAAFLAQPGTTLHYRIGSEKASGSVLSFSLFHVTLLSHQLQPISHHFFLSSFLNQFFLSDTVNIKAVLYYRSS
jgi:hypothetical protein